MQTRDLFPVLSTVALGTALALVPMVPSGSWTAAAESTGDGIRSLAAEVGLAEPPSSPDDEPRPASNETPSLDPREDPPQTDPTPGHGDDPVDTRAPEPSDDAGGPEADDGGDPEAGNRSQPDGSNDEPSRAEDPATGEEPPAEGAAPESVELGLGMHVNGLRRMENGPDARPNGTDFAYGQVWVGAWNLEHGWSNVGEQVEWLVERDVKPVIQLFYWGNDISKACFQDGCAGKSTAAWTRLVDELGVELEEHAQGHEVIVVLEPEFNKGNVATYEPLDAALAEKADGIRDGYPQSRVALGFGGWGTQNWDTWDRAMDASDMAGLQLMRGSTQDSQATYAGGADTLVRQAQRLHELSGDPVLVSDVALATYPGPPYLDLQADVLEELLDRRDELDRAGVEGLVYRAFLDDPSAPTAEYYGEAEVTWGLKHANGTAKPAWDVWARALAPDRA